MLQDSMSRLQKYPGLHTQRLSVFMNTLAFPDGSDSERTPALRKANNYQQQNNKYYIILMSNHFTSLPPVFQPTQWLPATHPDPRHYEHNVRPV